jgi:hypothetical protein
MDRMRDLLRFTTALGCVLTLGAGSLYCAVAVGFEGTSSSGTTTGAPFGAASATGGATVLPPRQSAYRDRGPRPGIIW